jgi:subtilase family serine protease
MSLVAVAGCGGGGKSTPPAIRTVGGAKRRFKNTIAANLRFLALCVVAVVANGLALPIASSAQQATSAARIVKKIDENQLVTLKGNTHLSAKAENDLGAVKTSLSMPDLTLVLSRSMEQQAAFETFIASQYDAGSSNYHHWLMPAEIGTQYGPDQADITTISNWLMGHGFAVTKIAKDGMSIRFSGTAGQVESTFHTQIHNLSVNGAAHIANMSDPQIPSALATVVTGIKALHNFLPQPLHKAGSTVKFNRAVGKWQRVAKAASADSTSRSANEAIAASSLHPQFGINSSSSLEEDVVPYDFATIYNVLPLWNAGITGTGQSIAIAGTSEINLSDVATFRNAFGLPAGLTPQQIDTNGLAAECTSTSGTCNIDDLIENSLDVEWSGAVATGAQIVLVVTGQNAAGTVDSLYDSADYVVENLTAKILNVSYGECELGLGTASNVAYYNLWQSAAAEGIAVFVATGDSGSPSCDQDQANYYGYPYSAQYGLSVSGMASTPYDTAVGGTDFSWCKPTITSSGDLEGCPTTSSSASPYWNATNNTTTGASASGYIPEIPWNDTCMNPLLASYLESFASYADSVINVTTPTNAEGACNYVQNYWDAIYSSSLDYMLAGYVDTVGGSGGASNCVANDGADVSSCTSSTTSTGTANGSITLSSDGWPKPSWQAGVTGIPADGVRDIPDVSFFAGAGALSSAYIYCVSNTNVGSCTYSDTEDTAEEAGGTSFASPAMAGVMALINQKAGGAQGNPNSQLYELAAKQTYSECSAESVTTSSSCYFNDIDTGTISMPCDYGATVGGATYDNGWYTGTTIYTGDESPNCTQLNANDGVGTLTNSSGSVAYNGATGFDLATGLGSLNVSNVVNAWVSDSSAATASVNVATSASAISAGSSLTVTVTVSGSSSLSTPTGSVVLSGGGYSASQGLTSGVATITIPANSLNTGKDTLTASYSGDTNYAAATGSATVTVTDIASVTVTAAATTLDTGQSLGVTATVSGANGTPTGTAKLAAGSYTSSTVTLSSGTATFTIPANSLTAGTATLTITYSGDSNYASATGTSTVTAIQSTYSLAATTPAAVSPGAATSSTVTVTSASDYSGAITLTCTATSTPANASYTPTCTVGSTVTMTSGTTSGTATLTIDTTGSTAQLQPLRRGRDRFVAGGGVLAFLVLLGIPARRRSWRAMVGVLVLLIALGSLSACGGSSSTSTTQTTPGSYTFTVKGQGNDPAGTTESTTFALTVN